jgi:predicted helicase
LGNPPYSGHSANTGDWISKLVRDYYFCEGQPLGERNPKWLQDDYVKFLRWAQWRIEQTGQGVLAFITNHGYLDNPTFRGMRQNLMQTFDEIYVLDLHGNAKKKETVPNSGEADKNVFDIQQGVAIGIFVKLSPEARVKQKEKAPALVRHCHLWGAQRQTKYEWLDGHHVNNTNWTTLTPAAPHYLFIPQDMRRSREYQRGWKITEIMPIHSLGIAAGRDHFTVAFSDKELRDRLKTFLELDSEAARRRFSLGPDSGDWRIDHAQADLAQTKWESNITTILYRPFDRRQTCYTGNSRGFHCRARQDVMRHFLQGPNLGLVTTRAVEIREGWTHVFATQDITQLHSVSLKEVNYLFPLYLQPNGKLPEEDLFAHDNGRRPNLSAEFVKQFCERLDCKFVPDGFGRPSRREVGPECIFNYAYAVFHSPTYRERYAEFLRADFPRLPLTSNWELFGELAALGHSLVDSHARGQGKNTPVGFPVKGTDEVRDVRFQPVDSLAIRGGKRMKHSNPCGDTATGPWPDLKAGRVWINDRQYFEPVPEAAWGFPIGGYLPAQRWLKDRRGHTLGFEEQAEYGRIVWAMLETRRLMSDIDASITRHGGWPIR